MARTYLVLTNKERRLVQPQMGISPPRRVADGSRGTRADAQTSGRERSPDAPNPRDRSDSPTRLEPAFLPPRPQQVEIPRGRRSPAAPAHRLSARHYQEAAPQSRELGTACPGTQLPALPLNLPRGSLACQALYENPAHVPNSFWTRYR